MASRYWVGDTNPAVWNDTNHWSATDGGAGGAGVPTADDDVVFTASNTNSCNLDVNPVCKSLTNADGYTGTLHGQGFSPAISGNFEFNAGALNLSTGTWTGGGSWDTSGIDPTVSTSTVILSGTANLTVKGLLAPAFYNLQIAAAGQTTTLLSALRVSGVLTLGTGTWTQSGSQTVWLTGMGTPLVNPGATVNIYLIWYRPTTASGTVTIAGGSYTSNVYMRSAVNNVTVNLGGDLTITGGLGLSAGSANTGTVFNSQNYAITAPGLFFGEGGVTGRVTANLGSSVLDLGSTGLTVTKDGGSHTLNLNSATITCAGLWRLSQGTGTITQDPGTSTVTMDGTAAQTVTSNGQSFNNLVLSNSHASGVTFADRLQCVRLTDLLDGSTIPWAAAAVEAPHAVSTLLDIVAVATNRITLKPSVAATPWYLSAPVGTRIRGVSVSYCQSANPIVAVDSIDGGNNSNFVFVSAAAPFDRYYRGRRS